MLYFLMPLEPCSWVVEIEEFTLHLKAKRTNVEIWNVNIPPGSISWSFDIEDDQPLVDLLPYHRTIVLDALENSLAKFTIW